MPFLSQMTHFAAAAATKKAAIMKRISKKIPGPHVWPAFKLVLVLLAVIVLLSILGHNYLSNMGAGESPSKRDTEKLSVPDGHNRVLGPNNYPFPERSNYGTDPQGNRPQLVEYNKEIEELQKIKASVSNELRDLESKRLQLQTTNKQYKTSIDELKVQHTTLTREIGQIKLTLDQLRFERDESQSYIPNIRAPVKIIQDSNAAWSNTEEDNILLEQAQHRFSPPSCTMETCFDFSRCSLVSGFPVYFYDPLIHLLTPAGADSAATLNETLLATVRQFFDSSVYRTTEPEKACVFIVLVGRGTTQRSTTSFSQSASSRKIEQFLHDLPYWGGDGRNHVLLHLSDTEPADPLAGVNTGRAILAKTIYTDFAFREGFDVVIPPNTGPVLGRDLWKNLPPLSPIRRKFILSYWGEFVPPTLNVLNAYAKTRQNAMNKENDYMSHKRKHRRKPLAILQNPHIPPSLHSDNKQTHSPYYYLERAIVSSVEAFSNSAQGDVVVDTSCAGKEMFKILTTNSSQIHDMLLQRSTPSDWALCGTRQTRADILLHSTFSLILAPLNTSVDSTLAFQIRVLEALQQNSIPVIIGSSSRSKKLLPFADSLVWERAAVTLPVPRITEVPFYLQSHPDEDIAALRLQGREFHQKFLGSTHSILETLVAVLRQRLDIPAPPIPNEPSPSAFSGNFTPLIYEGPDVEPDTDEVLGPIEAPFASETFRRNFSVGLLSDMFNKFGDPFHLYPHTPFQPVLPSEAKFMGSNFGFRPVNRGAGGDGISYSQALGGNFQREQFTVVMLTYEREVVLMQALQRFKGLPFLNKVVVVWNSELPPSSELKWPQIGVPIKVVKTKRNSLNNRFLPYEDIETEAILSIDDDAHLRHDEIVFGFRVWREERTRVVGFPGRYHAWNLGEQAWNYNSNYSCELSMVLTGAAFFHKYYAYMYSYVMPQAIRDKVDEYLNCEDIAMNFLVSHITRKPPVKVTSRWTFRCPGCPTTLFNDPTHFEERHKCINFFSQVYGYTPLLYTQFRVDSVLFKTRIPHDKKKCFKFI